MPDNIKLRFKLEQHHYSPRTAISPQRQAKLHPSTPRLPIRRVSIAVLMSLVAGFAYWAAERMNTTPEPLAQQPLPPIPSTALPTAAPVIPLLEPTIITPPASTVVAQVTKKNVLVSMAEAQLEKNIAPPEVVDELSIDAASEVDESIILPDTAPTQTAPMSVHIQRAQFTTAIKRREPVDRLVQKVYASNNINRLFYFTEIKNMRGRSVTHQWEYQGRVMARIKFRVGGDHWRTYSSKNLNQQMFGDWRVIVTDEKGDVLHSETVAYHRSPRSVRYAN